jgi:hypothetical protein
LFSRSRGALIVAIILQHVKRNPKDFTLIGREEHEISPILVIGIEFLPGYVLVLLIARVLGCYSQ